MIKKNVKYAKQMGAERPQSPFIPYSSHLTDDVIITTEGDFVCTWKVDGICHETADPEDVQLKLDQLNTLYRSIGSANVSIWTHQVRRQISDRLKSTFASDFARDLDNKYYSSLSGNRMMGNEIYLTLVYRPYTNRTERAFARARRSAEQLKDMYFFQLDKVTEAANQIESSLRKYGLERLGVYTDENSVKCSTMLEFVNFLISGYWQKVMVPKIPLNEYLGTSWVYSGTETIEIRSPTKTRFARGVDFKEYNDSTQAGILNGLMYSDYEYVMTQSFTFMSRKKGKDFLEKQQNMLQNSNDGSAQQIIEITAAIDLLTQGKFAMGEYHFSLMIFGDTVEEAAKNTSDAITEVQQKGFLASVITIATEAAFYAQLPGNWFYRPRIAGLTSRNFAGLCSFHNFAVGKRDKNPWGQALSMLQTPAGQPYYLNFHSTKLDEDSFDKKPLGNTRIIGKSGSGKTALMSFLLGQSLKYATNAPMGFTSVFFDKDRGAELTIRANNGKYFAFKSGVPSGMNPFQMEATEANILFLISFIKKLSTLNGKTITTMDETRINDAVRTVMRMSKHVRSITIFCQNITEGVTKEEKEDSIIKRLARWCDGGQYAWVFNNPEDKIDFSVANNFGFDGTCFLDNADICAPISMYLLHRVESVIDGRRFIYWMDECWKWVADEVFSEFVDNKQLTIRKQNGLGVFATQMPSSLLESKNGAALVQQCATEIYLPNEKADYTEYTQGFKCTDAEFEIIKNLDDESRMFLVKQGNSSALVKLDLGGFSDELAILSGSTDNIELLENIMAEVGEDPADWLPEFHRQRKLRRK